jgi:thiol:disulfide interchange protein DsbD
MSARVLIAASLALAFFLIAAAPSVARPVTVDVRVAAADSGSVTLWWRFDLADRWHVYGPFRNDTGFPPSVTLALPEGWTTELWGWPVPERSVLEGGILDHVYHHRLELAQTVRPAAGAALDEARARVAWLACRDLCIPGDTTLTVPLTAAVDPEAAAALARLRSRVPGPLPAGTATVERSPDLVTITVPGALALRFVPDPEGPLAVDLAADGAARGEQLAIRLRPESGDRTALTGLLIIDHKNGDQVAGTIVIQ